MKNGPLLRLVLRWCAIGCALAASNFCSGTETKPTLPPERPAPADASGKASRARLEWLRAEIARHDELYFKKSAPEISDAAYDALKRELRELDAKFPGAGATGDGIGDDRSGGFATHRHRERMLSLNKAYSEAELRAFYAKLAAQLPGEDAPLAFTVEPKYDGLAISATYERGELVRVVTRGDGTEGDDVTSNARALVALPERLRDVVESGRKLPVPELVEVRGEVYLTFAEFARINREQVANGEEAFAHPRNLAAGTLKQTAAAGADSPSRRLSAVFYGVGAMEPATVWPATQRELHALIGAWGLPGLEFRVADSSAGLWRAVQALGAERGRLPFPTDGAVVKLDDVALQRKLGASDTAPHWAVAYKFSAERAETRVNAITIQIGRTGVLTPVAELEPVRLGGSTVARASLHNREEITRKDVRTGDYVYVEKAGEIIPAVVGVNVARRGDGVAPFVFPVACPVCGSSVVAVAGEAAVRCPNYGCAAQVRRRIEHFVSKQGVDIAGFGPAMIEKVIARGWVTGVADIYALKREQLLTLGANVEKSTDRLLAVIEQSKGAELARVIQALGMPQVGAVASRELAGKCGGLRELAEVTREEWVARGVERSVADAVAGYFSRAENRAMIARLVAAGVGRERRPSSGTAEGAVAERINAAMAGKVFVFTGTLRSMSRAGAAEKVRAAGGVVRENVSRQTSWVVAGEGGGAKLTEARELGVAVISEAEFLALLERDE